MGTARSNAATILNFDLSQSGTGTLAQTVTYTTGIYSVTMTGLQNWGPTSASPTYNLFYGSSTGLGIDANSDHSLYNYGIQFSTAGLSLDASSVTLTISGTGSWQIYTSNTAGIVGNQPYVGGTGPTTINLLAAKDYSNNSSNLLLSSYISVVGTGGTVYINGLSVTSTNPAAAPEPSTILSLVIGLAILIPSVLKSRKSFQ